MFSFYTGFICSWFGLKSTFLYVDIVHNHLLENLKIFHWPKKKTPPCVLLHIANYEYSPVEFLILIVISAAENADLPLTTSRLKQSNFYPRKNFCLKMLHSRFCDIIKEASKEASTGSWEFNDELRPITKRHLASSTWRHGRCVPVRPLEALWYWFQKTCFSPLYLFVYISIFPWTQIFFHSPWKSSGTYSFLNTKYE